MRRYKLDQIEEATTYPAHHREGGLSGGHHARETAGSKAYS